MAAFHPGPHQLRSRLICAHCGRSWPARPFSKADSGRLRLSTIMDPKAAETLGRSRVRFHIDCGSYGRRPLRTVQCQFRTHARHRDRGDRTTTYLQSEDHRRHYESCQNSVQHAVQQRLGRHDAGRRRGDGELRMRPIGSRADTTRRSAARPPPCRRAGPVRNNASSPRADCPR